jgi:hypothetical protein
MNLISSTFSCLAFCLLTLTLAAQPKFNDPYSRYGLGVITNPNFAASQAMGNLDAVFHDPYHQNTQNPAAYSFLRSASFEVGGNARYTTYEKGTAKSTGWSGNLNYLSLAFPLKSIINESLDKYVSPFTGGMSFSLTPFSTVGYLVRTTLYDPKYGGVNSEYSGDGGTYRANWGNSLKYKDVSVGINLSYLFGKISSQRNLTFLQVPGAYVESYADNTNMRGFKWTAGTLYDYAFTTKNKGKDGKFLPSGDRLSVGLYGGGKTNVTFESEQLWLRARDADLDTLTTIQTVQKTGVLPSEVGLGIMYGRDNKWRVGVNYAQAGWSAYKNGLHPEEKFADTQSFSIGGEYIPNYVSYNSYFERIRYRAGFNYAADPRIVNGEQLKRNVFTFGGGFPILLPRQQQSFINLAVEIGQQGSTKQLKETFFNINLGFTLNDDTWFFKRRFE